MNTRMLKRTAVLAASAVVGAYAVVGLDHRLKVTEYTEYSGRINGTVKIALVTDLHSCRYGAQQQKLIRAIEAQKPDILLMSGDIFDKNRGPKYTEQFLKNIHDKLPCYMIFGNHECKCGKEDHFWKEAILEQYNVRVLSNELETLEINGTKLNVCGVADPTLYTFEPKGDVERFTDEMKKVKAMSDNGNYTVLMSHNPVHFKKYVNCGFDLVLCGHAHGGQWVFPGLINGVLAPGQGLFPKYVNGKYTDGDTTMIVSRGLARECTPVPRFYNRPEIVVIELKNNGAEEKNEDILPRKREP